MKKNLWLGMVIAVLVAGLGLVIGSDSIRFDDSFGALKKINPRIMSLILLPFFGAVYFAVTYLRKRNEERKWRNALLRTRSRKREK
jgi:hypothetical protein